MYADNNNTVHLASHSLCYRLISYPEIQSLLSHIAVCLDLLISVGIVRFEPRPFQTVVVRIENAIKIYNSSLVWQASSIGIFVQVELTFIKKNQQHSNQLVQTAPVTS